MRRSRNSLPRMGMAALVCALAAAPSGAGDGAANPEATGFSASVLALRDARVPAEVPGRVVKRLQDESASVKEGDPIVWLDDVLAKAALRTAEAERKQAQATLDWAKLELGRLQVLRDRGSIELEALDRAEVASRRAVAGVEAADARVHEVRTRLERAVIRAPFAGKLVRIHPQEGEYLRPGDTAFRLIDDSSLRIVAYVDASQLPLLRPGGSLEVRSELPRLKPLEARIVSVAPGTATQTRRFRVEARVDKPDPAWRPGMTAVARPLHKARGQKK